MRSAADRSLEAARCLALPVTSTILLAYARGQSFEAKRQAMLERAERHSKEGRLNEAIIEYTTASGGPTRSSTTYVPAYLALGQSLGSGGEFDEALKVFETAVQADPKSPPAPTTPACAVVQHGRLPEAIDKDGRADLAVPVVAAAEAALIAPQSSEV